jgi:hypothetical protein
MVAAPESIKSAPMSLEESSEEAASVTDAPGRAYLGKLAAVGDTACECTTAECGESVLQSWMMRLMAPGSSDYTLSDADRTREQSLLERLFACAATSDPKTRASIESAKQESKVARAKIMALLDDPYEGETATTRVAIRELRTHVRAMCACTTLACIEPLQVKIAEPPIVSTKREIEIVANLLAAVPTCSISVAATELLGSTARE